MDCTGRRVMVLDVGKVKKGRIKNTRKRKRRMEVMRKRKGKRYKEEVIWKMQRR